MTDDIRERFVQLQSKVDAVRRLHRPPRINFSGKEKCVHCGYVWPCPTTVATD
jgi:hypothetical protein